MPKRPKKNTSILSGRNKLTSRLDGAIHGIKRHRGNPRSGGGAKSKPRKEKRQRVAPSAAARAEVQRERMAWTVAKKFGGEGVAHGGKSAANFELAAPSFIVQRLDDKAMAVRAFESKFGATSASLGGAPAAAAPAAPAQAISKGPRRRGRKKKKAAVTAINPFAVLESDGSSDDEAEVAEAAARAALAGAAPRKVFALQPATVGDGVAAATAAAAAAAAAAASKKTFSLFASTIGSPVEDSGIAAAAVTARAAAATAAAAAAAAAAAPPLAKHDDFVDGVSTAEVDPDDDDDL